MKTTEKTIIDNIVDRSTGNLEVTAFESLGGSSINYKTFFDMIDVYAKGFKELGIENGDMVTLCSLGTLDTMLNFAALNRIGAVVQFVNPTYMAADGKRYIDDTNTKLLVCLDRLYPVLKKKIEETNIKKILLSSISEYSSFLFKIVARRQKVKDEDKIEGVEYIELPDFIKMGERSSLKIERIPYEKDKPAVISYTSGTTGYPKGIVHTNDSINNMISIYAMTGGFGPGRGDRNLVLIPPMYLTSFVHSLFGTMIVGLTNILQPIYDPTTFGKDLKKYEPKTVVASKAHYINLADCKLPKGSLSFLQYPYCGGEAFSIATAERINKILKYYGIPKMILGYGQSEFGTMTMFNSDIPHRSNESGILIPTVHAKILDLVTGEPVQKGKRGELYIQTPAVMKEYLNNPEATANFFVYDENGERWAKTGDIAAVIYQYKGKDVYEVSGRKSDSFVTLDNEVVYLFDIENEVEKLDFVKEAEVVSTTVDGIEAPVVHVVLEEKYKNLSNDFVVKAINAQLKDKFDNKHYIPFAYKIRDSFSTSPISGKRDYNILQYETDGFYRLDSHGEVEPFSFEKEDVKKLARTKE